MTNRKTQRPNRASNEKRSQLWLLAAGVAAVAAIAVGVVVMGGSDDESPAAGGDSAELTLAAANAANADIRILTGSAHTVYHSQEPLPSPDSPRVDGRPTLVWFSATWCTTCERMEPFAHATANRLAEELVFVEKSVDEEPSAAGNFRVLGTPTFVLIDSTGSEVARFGYQPDAARFEAAIRAALAEAG